MDRSPSIVASAARTVLIVLLVLGALTLLFLLRRPIGWIVLAVFIAVVLSGPVERLARHVPRGLSIAAVYLALLVLPVVAVALLVPPIVTEVEDLARSLPGQVAELRDVLRDNEDLRRLDERFGIGDRLQDLAAEAPAHAGDAAAILADIGLGVLDSLFAAVAILVLSVFLVANGRPWALQAIGLLPGPHRERVARTFGHIARAVTAYVQAQLLIALIAAVSGYVVMTILGVPFREPLAVLIAFGSLIPVIGSLLWGVAVGLVTLTHGFPTTTILWVVWAIAYPQLENYVLQPVLQGRAVQVQPFVVIFAVICGAALLGIAGAVLAIPAAAALQIVGREWWAWRREQRELAESAPA